MAQKRKKQTYRVRYDRIIFVLAILAVLILIMTSCVSSCTKRMREDKPGGTVENDLTVPDTTEPTTMQASTEPPVAYATVSLSSDKVNTGDLVLVNAAHPCTFDDEEVQSGTSADISFVTIKSILDTKTERHYTAADWTVGVDRDAALAMDAWFEAFYQETGNTDLRMIGGYKADASDLDFRAGRTLTIGVFPDSGSSYAYKAEGEYAWIAEHAADYGFILRYPEDKDSYFDDDITSRRTATFRYVGIGPAGYIAQNGLCLEEFLETVKTYTIDNLLEVTVNGENYGMYYVPANAGSTATTFSVPSDEKTYEISGNNMDGFVISAKLG